MYKVIEGIKHNKTEDKNQSQKHKAKNVSIKYYEVPKREFQNREMLINVNCSTAKGHEESIRYACVQRIFFLIEYVE